MENLDENVDEILNEFSKIRHKIIFFFMPENIVFQKPKQNDDPDWVTLKSISPLFYWCSAHEFPDFDKNYKYLFQYQIYSIETQSVIPNELSQKWCQTKNEIRNEIISFLEMWSDHKRILLNTVLKTDILEFQNNNEIQDFSTFANFVGKSIFDLKHFYIKQASTEINFDILQKEFWKTIALNSSNNVFENKYPLPEPEKITKKTTKKQKTTVRKKRNGKQTNN